MGENGAQAASSGEAAMLEELEALLQQQITLARRGDIAGLERLNDQTRSAVEQLAGKGVLQSADSDGRRERLRGLYRELRVIIAAHEAETAGQLDRLRLGMKTLRAYRKTPAASR